MGPNSGTCLDRANALRRIGHQVEQLDLRCLLPKTSWVDRITWHLGGDLFSSWLMLKLTAKLMNRQYDICYVDGGEWVTPKIIDLMRKHAKKIVSYSIDDPLGPRDGARFKAFRRSLPYYDINAVVREENVTEALAMGAKNVIRIYRSADEKTHAPRPLTDFDHSVWGCDVLFLGTWFPERGPFMLDLIQRGVPLTIRGPNWHKAPEWKQLKSHWAGDAIGGDDYAKAIQCAKVNLGLLSKENRDLHTTRSLEIPALGGLLCAERTSEHTAMYVEGYEALFWKDAEECAAVCFSALADPNRCLTIADAGHRRLKQNGHYNEKIVASLVAACNLPT
jgi:hypothetical protein